MPDTILDRFVIGPDDLARFNPNCGPGDPYGGSHDLSQSYLFRPLPGQPSYRTVVPNLYMVGAATWPGHGINGGSGHIVANQLLAGHGDRGKSRDGSVLPAARLTTAAEDLREVLEKPLFNPVLNILVGEGKLDYEVYLRTTDLLSLQTPSGKLSDPDELMFQIVHQAQEVWLKLLAHELTEVVSSLDTDALWDVTARLDRAVRITHCLAEELRVLETLTPDTYQLIRRNLGNGSGQESPGYNAVRTAAPYVAAALDRLLARAGVQVEDVYVPALTSTAGLKRVCELLLDFDERFQQWLVTHFMLVRRTIGTGRDTKALDGLSVRILLGRTTKPLFDSLWQARDTMTANWRREGGHRPGATRGAESS